MKIELSCLYILLASAGYDKKTFEQVVTLIKKNDSKTIIKEFSNIKNSIEKMKHTLPEVNQINENVSSDVKGKIYSILIVECGLSVNQCLSLINDSIKMTYPSREVPIINSKKGFDASINSLERFFTKSELLHIASKLRNELVHGKVNFGDWMLKE
ncbi:hypothetical protein [Leclercia adecarboxylata]|uniref:hypothetical protein n=1 Tax=Leclercia adecarboxylata TaxID=83655 RepID=UPI0011A03942|nr:hypothetical protein [Leclercia adecarboxylata]